ncbi:MAG: response regulator, partial [Spartobacteria bacterium]
ECDGAEDGLVALGILEKEPTAYNLVVLDWNMPNMNGLDLLRKIRSTDKLKHIPVLMLTTEGSHLAIVTAIKAGATAYMTKPFIEKDLQTRMLDCLGLGFE